MLKHIVGKSVACKDIENFTLETDFNDQSNCNDVNFVAVTTSGLQFQALATGFEGFYGQSSGDQFRSTKLWHDTLQTGGI